MSELITVKRVAKLEEGVFGTILHLGVPFAVTLERSYGLDPKIPAGTYTCVATKFNRGGYRTFEVMGVIGHSRLLFHKANWETDLEGCVGIGEGFAVLDGRLAIAQSGAAFGEFMEKVGHLPSFTVKFEDCTQ
jgi:hypothetical protein